jgi:hypothetical protein
MITDALLRGLPGEDRVRQGLLDIASGRLTVPACLVAIASDRLEKAGLVKRTSVAAISTPESQLYRLLREEGGDAYSKYNALLRELVSFEQALDHRRRRLGEI